MVDDGVGGEFHECLLERRGDVGELVKHDTEVVERADTPADALGVGVTIERLDIADLDDAMSGLTAPDVLNAYTHLRQGSQRHLAAFGG